MAEDGLIWGLVRLAERLRLQTRSQQARHGHTRLHPAQQLAACAADASRRAGGEGSPCLLVVLEPLNLL